MPFAVAEPADAGGKTLECDAFFCHVNPSMQSRIVWEKFEQCVIGGLDVLRIAAQCDPTEGAAADAELRANVGGNESGERECIGVASVECALTDVVAVIKGLRAAMHELDHESHMLRHRLHRDPLILGCIARAKNICSFARHVDGVVAFEWIVRARLIGERVGRDVAFLQATQEMDDVAEPSDGNALSLRFEFECAINRAIEIFNDLVEISIMHALGESFARNLRNQANAMIHGDCEWLRAAHAAATARDIERALECSSEMLTRAFGVGFVGSLHDALRADVDP